MAIPEVAIQLLQADLQRLPERLRDEKFARELYCALAGNRWSKDGEVVALSWKRAANLVNALPRGHARLSCRSTAADVRARSTARCSTS